MAVEQTLPKLEYTVPASMADLDLTYQSIISQATTFEEAHLRQLLAAAGVLPTPAEFFIIVRRSQTLEQLRPTLLRNTALWCAYILTDVSFADLSNLASMGPNSQQTVRVWIMRSIFRAHEILDEKQPGVFTLDKVTHIKKKGHKPKGFRRMLAEPLPEREKLNAGLSRGNYGYRQLGDSARQDIINAAQDALGKSSRR